jgi:NAD(P)-dependent dehydrogenase (short-subunit alcohol dehydrogenase family)
MSGNVVVVTGAGEMGHAIARRLASGAHVVLADVNPTLLDTVSGKLRAEGCEVTPHVTDVSTRDSVAALAERAASLGVVRHVVHTAGVSPALAPIPTILAVNLLGVALVAEEFAEVVAPGGAGVVIASMSGYLYPGFTDETARLIAATPADQLLGLAAADPAGFAHAGMAYSFTKRANLVQVQAASVAWAGRGARINSISPGIIDTAQGRAELRGEQGVRMQAMIDGSNVRRMGTPADIADAVEFLLSPAASFISGVDLLVDGGAIAAIGAPSPR